MNASLTQVARLMSRRTRSGQSIIIIAFAFIALIAFVGIATDVAMLFVRFGALRRAVDAASIAAAGQIRENADYFTMTSVAEQFIKVHGIDPTTVKVETCETEMLDYANSHGVSTDYARSALINGQDPPPPAVSPPAVKFPKSDLCKDTPQKLVRVSAQIQSPTSFLSLIGWRAVTLSTSSVSQTASLDVALLLDTSLSESNDTAAAMADTGYYKVGTPNGSGANYFAKNDTPGNINPLVYAQGDINKGYAGIAGGSPCTSVSTVAPYNASPYFTNCNNADSLRFFRDFINPSPAGPTATNDYNTIWKNNSSYINKLPAGRMGLGLGEAPIEYTLTPSSVPHVPPYTDDTPAWTLADHDANGRKVIRYECWYFPKTRATQLNAANYSWAGCCNDPSIQSDNAAGTTTFNPFLKTNFNTDPDWYVYDNGTFDESIIMTTGTFDSRTTATVVAGGRQWNTAGAPIPYTAANGTAGQYNNASGVNAYAGGSVYPFNRGDGNYSDLICRPFKDVRDAARRFLKRLDFVRGDRVVLVTFDSAAKAIVPYGNSLPIITDQNTAVRALNMQVGVEVNPFHLGNACQQFGGTSIGADGDPVDWMGNTKTSIASAYYNGVNRGGPNTSPAFQPVTNYWTKAQCPDTNMGDGILLGSNSLVDPQWIRRDSVWVMVVLSDGYPNRTPPVGTSNVGSNAQENSTYVGIKPGNPKDWQGDANVKKYCDSDPASANYSNYGKEPQACAAAPQPNLPAVPVPPATPPPGSMFTMSWGLRYNDPLDPNYTDLRDFPPGNPPVNDPKVVTYWSFGFCPKWTFDKDTQEDFSTTYWPWANNVAGSSNPVPWCTDNNPVSRHFCMTPKGDINPLMTGLPPADAYSCDKNYDAMDYAMDVVDFAALKDYTAQSRGNFIAMYSIFFEHNPVQEDNIALGVKMGHYIADAGDNGEIDNPIQHWYRDKRDADTVKPPIGSNCPFVATPCNSDANHNTTSSVNFLVQDKPADDNTYWSGQGYTTSDPCVDKETYTASAAPGDHFWMRADTPANLQAYHDKMRQNCGQFFYAANIGAVNGAFTEIAGRLFTRLSR